MQPGAEAMPAALPRTRFLPSSKVLMAGPKQASTWVGLRLVLGLAVRVGVRVKGYGLGVRGQGLEAGEHGERGADRAGQLSHRVAQRLAWLGVRVRVRVKVRVRVRASCAPRPL